MRSLRASALIPPVCLLVSSPFLKMMSVGIALIPSSAAFAACSSVFTFAKTALSLYSPASFSKLGLSAMQGPHQGAQKSMITGRSVLSASLNVVSVSSCTILLSDRWWKGV